MTYDVALRAYCRSVGGALRLKKQQKQEILKGLRQELEERFSSAETLTLEEINAEIGAYDKVANELMESVPLKERERYLTRRKWGSRIAIITFPPSMSAPPYCRLAPQGSEPVQSPGQPVPAPRS